MPDRAGWRALVHPDDLEPLQAACRQAAKAVPPTFDTQFRIRRADDGAERWIASTGQVESDAAGQPVRMLMTVSPPGHEHYFEELARLTAGGARPDPSTVAALRQRFDTDQLSSLATSRAQ